MNIDLYKWLMWVALPKKQPRNWITKVEVDKSMEWLGVPKSKVRWRDDKNKAFTLEELEKVVRSMPKIPMTYRIDVSDCDKFATMFTAGMQMAYPGVYCREIDFQMKTYTHAVNLILTCDGGVYIVEPQNVGTGKECMWHGYNYLNMFLVQKIKGVW